MNRYLIVILLVLFLSGVSFAMLPKGHEGARWGMSADELKRLVEDLVKADNKKRFYFGEHFEIEPDVYYKEKGKDERIEYYFYNGRLYKIFIIYGRELYETSFYEDLVKKTKEMYGVPKDVFEEKSFGLKIFHALWEDGETTLDVRKGAGFIFQVMTEKATAETKEKMHKKRKGI